MSIGKNMPSQSSFSRKSKKHSQGRPSCNKQVRTSTKRKTRGAAARGFASGSASCHSTISTNEPGTTVTLPVATSPEVVQKEGTPSPDVGSQGPGVGLLWVTELLDELCKCDSPNGSSVTSSELLEDEIDLRLEPRSLEEPSPQDDEGVGASKLEEDSTLRGSNLQSSGLHAGFDWQLVDTADAEEKEAVEDFVLVDSD